MAYLDVINKGIDSVFLNTVEDDIALYPASSNQSIHLGCITGGSSNSMLEVTRSNVEINGDVNLAGVMYRTTPVLAYKRNIAQSVVNVIETTVLFDTVDTGTQGTTGLTYNSGTGIFTNASGRTLTYIVNASVNYAAQNSTGARALWIRSSAYTGAYLGFVDVGSSPDYTALTTSAIVVLPTGSNLQVVTWQNNGASLNLSGGGQRVQIALL